MNWWLIGGIALAAVVGWFVVAPLLWAAVVHSVRHTRRGRRR